MTHIRIVPAGARDQAMHQAQFEALRRSLSDLGYDATVDIGIERRSVAATVVIYVALRLAERVTDDAIDVIIERVKQTLRNLRRPPSGEKRHAVIFGPDEEVLADVELEDDDTDVPS